MRRPTDQNQNCYWSRNYSSVAILPTAGSSTWQLSVSGDSMGALDLLPLRHLLD